MISGKVFKNKNNEITGFSFTGHSGYDGFGKDIVCAAVSSAVQMTILGLCDILKLDINYSLLDGEAECTIPQNISFEERNSANVLCNSMLIFLEEFEKTYSEYFSLVELEV